VIGSNRSFAPLVFWLGIIAAALVLWLSGQAGAAWNDVRDAHLVPLLFVLLLGILLPVIHALRWKHVMAALETPLTPRLATEITVSSSLINYASPGYVGAPVKALLTNHTARAPYPRTILSMAFEQGLDFLVLLLASAVALLLVGPGRFVDLIPASDRRVQFAVVALAVVGALAVLVVGKDRVRRMLARIGAAFQTLWGQVSRGYVLTMTLLYWLAQAAVVMLLLWALALPLTISGVVALASLPLLAGQIVPLPGGVGAREVVIVALSGAIGVSSSSLLGLAILQRVLLVVALPLSLAALRLWHNTQVTAEERTR
jgi:uncharacterized membrane protein YbhN (UPF0104 family)